MGIIGLWKSKKSLRIGVQIYDRLRRKDSLQARRVEKAAVSVNIQAGKNSLYLRLFANSTELKTGRVYRAIAVNLGVRGVWR